MESIVLAETPQDKTTKLPDEARNGLMRAWLAILRQRHPGVVWIPAEHDRTGQLDSKRR